MRVDFRGMEAEMDRLAEKMSTITSSSARVSDALRDQRKKVAELSGKATSFLSGPLFLLFKVFFTACKGKFLPVLEFELLISGVRSDIFANCTTTKAAEFYFVWQAVP